MDIPTNERESKYIIFALIFMLSNKLQTIGDSFFEEVSTKQWFVLLVLGILGEHTPTLSELSEAVGSSHQNVKQLVLKLEQKGYVEILKDSEDARRLRIKATPKSEAFSREYHEKSAKFMNQLFGSFPQEELKTTEQVMLTMKTILEGMEKDYVKG
ncbi:MAG: Transcriptional regulator, MarR family [Herbinix sp.]|nr:Transcriptional regulator, MarR family [Herbinix sp.]